MASGDTLISWEASQGIPGASAFPALVRRNNHMVLGFDDTTDETVYFEGIMPRHYAGGGVTISLAWLAATATSAAVMWETGFERHDDDVTDLDADSFATNNFASSTAASASGETQYVDIAHTNGAQMDSVAAGEHFRLRVTRDANGTNGTDGMAGDAQLLSIEIRES